MNKIFGILLILLSAVISRAEIQSINITVFGMD
jgi:hypothetical protein